METPAICISLIMKQCSCSMPVQPPTLQPILLNKPECIINQEEQRGSWGLSWLIIRLQ